jgi:tRNA threonylcarbamoyladenosine biosynthesis protein TsaB
MHVQTETWNPGQACRIEFYMLVLALDTTTRPGSIALARDGSIVSLYEGDANTTHGERLPGDLLRVLGAHALRVADVDIFAVASGPGSFTGLRIGIATMQGLALANDKSLVGISALDALNELARSVSPQRLALSPKPSALSPECEVAAWMDAQRGQVFSATYVDAAVLESALVERPADILARWQREGRRPGVFVGDGALIYRDLICRTEPTAHIVDPLPPLAPAVARLAAACIELHGPALPDAIRPLYIRRSDAELARDRKDRTADPDRRADRKVGSTTAGE